MSHYTHSADDPARLYKDGGIAALKQLDFYRPSSELVAHEAAIRQAFTEKPPATVKEAAERIEKLTGIRREQSQVAAFMKKLGEVAQSGTNPSQSRCGQAKSVCR